MTKTKKGKRKGKRRTHAQWIWQIKHNYDRTYLSDIPMKHRDVKLCLLYIRKRNPPWNFNRAYILNSVPLDIRAQIEAIIRLESD